MDVSSGIELTVRAVEVAGVLVIAAGTLVAIPLALLGAREAPELGAYRLYRRYLGQAILLGLELLVASDIIRTVTHTPVLREVAVLGLIVVIRTFLSFALEVELTGRWPWARGPESPQGL